CLILGHRPTGNVPEHDEVLRVPRFIESVLLFDVRLDRRGQGLLAVVKGARSDPDQAPGQRYDKQCHRNDEEEPSKYKDQHLDSYFASAAGSWAADCRALNSSCVAFRRRTSSSTCGSDILR